MFVTSPFTQPAVMQAAMRFNKADCVQPRPAPEAASSSSSSSKAGGSGHAAREGGAGEHAQQQQQQQQQQPPPPLLGKMPLRLAFPEVPTCWRGKDPIEVRGRAGSSRCKVSRPERGGRVRNPAGVWCSCMHAWGCTACMLQPPTLTSYLLASALVACLIKPQVGCGTTELGDRPWLPGAPAGYFSARIRCG